MSVIVHFCLLPKCHNFENISLFQVLISVVVFALASSAPLDPLTAAVGATTAAVGATVNTLGQAGASAAFGAAGLGSGIILKHLVTGDGSIPRLSAGINTGLGLGPLRLGGKVGAGFGGVGPGTWYQPLSEEETLLLQAQLGLGLGQTDLYTGAGVGLNYGWSKEEVPTKVDEEGKVIGSEIVEVGEWVPVGEPVVIGGAKQHCQAPSSISRRQPPVAPPISVTEPSAPIRTPWLCRRTA